MVITIFIWDFVAETVLGEILDWLYGQLVGFLGNFFAEMGGMGAELFEMEWVQGIVLFFSYLGWALTAWDMVVEPVHAGVECGAFAQKNPHLDMVAIGPTLIDVHTPDEKCNLVDVQVTTELVVEILKRIAQ